MPGRACSVQTNLWLRPLSLLEWRSESAAVVQKPTASLPPGPEAGSSTLLA